MSRVAPFRLAMAFIAVGLCVGSIQAQQPGRGRGGPGGGFTQSPTQEKLGYLRNEAVQKDLEVADDQKADLTKISDEARRAREAGGNTFNRESFANLSEDERRKRFTEMQQKAEATAKETWKKVEAVLLPVQLARLQEIYIQVRGTRALEDAEVAKELAITEPQKEKLAAVREEMGTKMREAFQAGGGQEGARERFAAMRKESEDKTTAVLTADQKAKFAKMKGDPFDVDAAGLRGFGGGGGGNRPGGQPGQGGQPRTRPGGNNNPTNN